MTDHYEGSELEEATREYVARLKDAYPAINEQDLYRLVLDIARRRVEEAADPAPPAGAEEALPAKLAYTRWSPLRAAGT